MAEKTTLAEMASESSHDKAKRQLLKLMMNDGLYSFISFGTPDGINVISFINSDNHGLFDFYCTSCEKETSFSFNVQETKYFSNYVYNENLKKGSVSVFFLGTACQRCNFSYVYSFRLIDKKLVKIGQHPSIGDISFKELKYISKSLDELDRKELGTAIGLFSHDAASGAFTYLRRVFERMIVRAHQRQTEQGMPVEGFDGLKMGDKIAALKTELPESMVRNSSVFAVLSKGIHELSDEQCRSLFPVVKAVIFQILEQEEHKRMKKITQNETDRAFDAILSDGVLKKL
jgi:hypothetical protein